MIFRLFSILLLSLTLIPFTAFSQQKTIITDCHNYYLPGNSLAAIAVAISEGAEVILLELALSSDGTVILLHDTVLNNITNVSEHFPDRIREDGSFQSIDFSFDELSQLSLLPNHKKDEGSASANTYPAIRIPSLTDALGLIQIMEQKLNRKIGIVAEIKKSWIYQLLDTDIGKETLTTLYNFDYTNRDDLYIASYDPKELQRLHNTIVPAMDMNVKILQLIEANDGNEVMRFERNQWQPYNYDWLLTKFGLKALSSFVDAIGIKPEIIINTHGKLKIRNYIEDAHMLDIKLFAYPFDPFCTPLPSFAQDLETLTEYCLFSADFDGVLTSKDTTIRKHLAQIYERQAAETEKPKTSIEKLLDEVKKQKNVNTEASSNRTY